MQISSALNLPNPRLTRGQTGPALYGASLDLRLSDSSELDPRITFSRASNATRVGPTGLIEYAPHNLVTYSEQFDNAAWAKTNTTVTANDAVAPDGTTTADLILDNSTSAAHFISQNSTYEKKTYTASVYMKQQSSGFYGFIRFVSGAIWSNNDGVIIDLSDGSLIAQNGIESYTIENKGNGWYRVSISDTPDNPGSGTPLQIGVTTGTGLSSLAYVGNGTNGIYIWGAQLNVGALQPYYPTTVKNLLGYTQEFDNAAWTKSNSFVQTNLLTYSQDFDNAAWAKVAATISANSTTAPDGTSTADKIAEDTATNQHRVNITATTVSGATHTLSVYVKTAERFRVRMRCIATSGFADAIFNLNTDQVTFGSGIIQDVGNGWKRLSISGVADGTSTICYVNVLDDTSTLSYTGTAGFGLFLWGAQLVQGDTAGDYTRTFGSAKAVGYVAPDGSVTAEKLVEDTANSTHFVRQNVVANTGGSYTSSVYIKKAERTKAVLVHFDGSAFHGVSIDLDTGNISAPPADYSLVDASSAASVVSIGTGWYRVSITKTQVSTTAQLRVSVQSGSNGVYTGDGTSGIYIWGAQLSDSASVDPYVYNPVAAPSASAYYGPRFDYDPVTLAPKGLLIEEQRTNLLTYSEQIDNAAWSKSGLQGVTSNAIASPDGTVNADLVIPSTGAVHHFVSQLVTGAAHNFSTYVKAGGYSSVILFFSVHNSYVTFDLSTQTVTETSGTITSSSITDVGNGWYRVSVATSLTTHTEARIYVTVGGTYATRTTAGDGTSGVYVWGAQLEAGSFPTSYIPTTSASVTRSADVATMVGANFSNWYNQDEGTVFAEFTPRASAGIQHIFAISDGTNNNRIQQFRSGTGVQSRIVSAGVQTNPGTVSPSAQDTNSKTLLSYKVGVDQGVSALNGVLGGASTPNAVPVVAIFVIGQNHVVGNLEMLNGHISRIAYFPRRLANTELQAITA